MRKLILATSIAAVALGTVALLSGCGGGGSSTASFNDAVSCLDDKGITPNTNTDDLDYVAQDAGEGAFDAAVGSNSATVVFERSESDAKRTMAAYELFAGAFDSSVEDILYQSGPVVVVWDRTPSDFENHQLSDCLSA